MKCMFFNKAFDMKIQFLIHQTFNHEAVNEFDLIKKAKHAIRNQ